MTLKFITGGLLFFSMGIVIILALFSPMGFSGKDKKCWRFAIPLLLPLGIGAELSGFCFDKFTPVTLFLFFLRPDEASGVYHGPMITGFNCLCLCTCVLALVIRFFDWIFCVIISV